MKLLVVLLVVLMAGCPSDEQWDAFCPDGHCPLLKAGKAINAQAEEDALNRPLRTLPTIEEVRP